MSTPRLVHAAVEASRADGASIGEDPGRLQVAGKLTRAALAAWQAVAESADDWSTFECYDSTDDLVPPRSVGEGEDVRMRVNFEPADGAVDLFTVEGWRSFLRDDEAAGSIAEVRLAFDEAPFETHGFAVRPWTGRPAAAALAGSARGDGPRRHVRCQSPEAMAPLAIEPYVAKTRPGTQGEAWREWTLVAADLVARSLPDDIYFAEGERRVGLSGQPPRRLELGTFDPGRVPFDDLQSAAVWVYLSGQDVEVRHSFLASELAREWPADTTFCRGLEKKLKISQQSAELLYKAHLRSGSKDILKSLADLRKSLVDDVGKLVQQARDLASGVWRDVVVAIGVVAIRYGLDAAKAAAAQATFAGIFLLVAVYIGLSFQITTNINDRYLANAKTSRVAFRTKLYGYLDEDDYQALAERPVEEAVNGYRAVERRTRIVVIVVVTALVSISAYEGYDLLTVVYSWIHQGVFRLWAAARHA